MTKNNANENTNVKTNYFTELYKVDVSDVIETKKAGNTELKYLSWAWAWAEIKRLYPNSSYVIHKYGEDNKPYLNDPQLGIMVTTSVTVNGITHEMWLPVMDHSNKAMKDHIYTYKVNKYDWKDRKRIKVGVEDVEVEPATMFDINTTIMRCLVKNIGMHGLGLSIYAGEDIPRDLNEKTLSEAQKKEQEAELKKHEEETKKAKEQALEYVKEAMINIKKQLNTEDTQVAYRAIKITESNFLEMYTKNIVGLAEYIYNVLNPKQQTTQDEKEVTTQKAPTQVSINEL